MASNLLAASNLRAMAWDNSGGRPFRVLKRFTSTPLRFESTRLPCKTNSYELALFRKPTLVSKFICGFFLKNEQRNEGLQKPVSNIQEKIRKVNFVNRSAIRDFLPHPDECSDSAAAVLNQSRAPSGLQSCIPIKEGRKMKKGRKDLSLVASCQLFFVQSCSVAFSSYIFLPSSHGTACVCFNLTSGVS